MKNKKIKICMVIDVWTPIFGGGKTHVDQLMKGLIEDYNCKIDLFVRKLKDDKGKKYIIDEKLYNGKLNIFRVGPCSVFFNFFGRIVSIIYTTIYLFFKARKNKYDVIHAFSYVSGLPAIIVGKLLNIPVIYTVLGANNMEIGKKGLFYSIEKFLLTGIKYDKEISVLNNFLKYKNRNKNIEVIPNGVNIDLFDKISVEDKYEGFNLLWVGRYNWEKGLDYLIKGLGLVDKKLLKEKGFKLNLVGDGPDRGKINKLINELNLTSFINIKGKIFGDELIREYKKNTVFILPSITEGQPLTVLEAYASSLPVIATNVGDNMYFINENNGFLIKSKSTKEIKNIIEKVLKIDINILDNIGNNGYNLVGKKYTWKIMIKKIYNIYKKLK